MTLRELINYVMDRGNFHKTVTFLHTTNTTFKERSIHDVTHMYSNMVAELLELPGSDELSNYTIIIEPAEQDGEDFIDTHLIDSEGNRVAMDLVDWNEIIDLKINDKVSRELSEMLAHVLYELSWWGFTNQSITDQREELIEQSENRENLIEFSLSGVDIL